MAMGERESERQEDLFITHDRLPKSPEHMFYVKLNQLLAEVKFDRWVEASCEPYYASGKGRPSVPPGTYYRMLLVGYFEGISSQRGIVLAAEIYHATQPDAATLEDSVVQAQVNQQAAGSEQEIEDVVADKGYHTYDTLGNFAGQVLMRDAAWKAFSGCCGQALVGRICRARSRRT